MIEALTTEEQQRYARHVLIPEVGEAGQLLLKQASVLLIGAGALGSPAALYLAAAGIGRIGIVDPDLVESSNLQRQIIHGESCVGKAKVDSALERLRELNSMIEIETFRTHFTPENASSIADSYDVIVDGSDNYPTRFLTNDVAFFQKKPLIYGAIYRFQGQSSVLHPQRNGPCYRCFVPELPEAGSVPNCREAGVIGALPGIIGSLQAMNCITYLLGIGSETYGTLTTFDALSGHFRQIQLQKDPQCRLCGPDATLFDIQNQQTNFSPTCTPSIMQSISSTELHELITTISDICLIDVREVDEYAIAHIPQATLIPLAQIPARAEEIAKDQPVYVICKVGGRSGRAVQFLESQGFTNLINVNGGMDAWMDSGFAYESL